jgi:hypothetical protein
VIDNSEPIDVRAYLRADEELGLLYAQDVSCSASFGEGRVFRTNPARDPAPEGCGWQASRADAVC